MFADDLERFMRMHMFVELYIMFRYCRVLVSASRYARCLNKEVFLVFSITLQTKEADKLRYFVSLHLK